jgi:hypothetical protein
MRAILRHEKCEAAAHSAYARGRTATAQYSYFSTPTYAGRRTDTRLKKFQPASALSDRIGSRPLGAEPPARTLWGVAMASRTNQGPRGSVNSGRFEALLDKLVAVQMDLEPVCGVGTARAQVAASLESIADACDVLRSAIADVRNIIHQADGLMDLPEPHLYTISQVGWA